MPSMPAAASDSFTSSSLNGLMMAMMSFMRRRVWGAQKLGARVQPAQARRLRARAQQRTRATLWAIRCATSAQPTASLRLHDPDVQLLQLPVGDRRRALRHEVLAFLRLRERDHV